MLWLNQLWYTVSIQIDVYTVYPYDKCLFVAYKNFQDTEDMKVNIMYKVLYNSWASTNHAPHTLWFIELKMVDVQAKLLHVLILFYRIIKFHFFLTEL